MNDGVRFGSAFDEVQQLLHVRVGLVLRDVRRLPSYASLAVASPKFARAGGCRVGRAWVAGDVDRVALRLVVERGRVADSAFEQAVD